MKTLLPHTLTILALSLLLACHAQAMDLESYTEISPGYYAADDDLDSGLIEIGPGRFAKILSNGNIVEIATTSEAAAELMNSDEAYNDLVEKINTAPTSTTTTGPNLCTGYETFQGENFLLGTNSATLSGSASIQAMIGPVPPPPAFAYARVKVKLRVYDANGVMIRKSVSIRRNAVLAGNGACNGYIPQNPNTACYALAQASTSVLTSGGNTLRWTVKSEFVIDKPDADDMGLTAHDCYETAALRVISPSINL